MSLVQLVGIGLLVAFVCLVIGIVSLRLGPAPDKKKDSADSGGGNCSGGSWGFDGDGGGDGGGD